MLESRASIQATFLNQQRLSSIFSVKEQVQEQEQEQEQELELSLRIPSGVIAKRKL